MKRYTCQLRVIARPQQYSSGHQHWQYRCCDLWMTGHKTMRHLELFHGTSQQESASIVGCAIHQWWRDSKAGKENVVNPKGSRSPYEIVQLIAPQVWNDNAERIAACQCRQS